MPESYVFVTFREGDAYKNENDHHPMVSSLPDLEGPWIAHAVFPKESWEKRVAALKPYGDEISAETETMFIDYECGEHLLLHVSSVDVTNEQVSVLMNLFADCDISVNKDEKRESIFVIGNFPFDAVFWPEDNPDSDHTPEFDPDADTDEALGEDDDDEEEDEESEEED